MIRLLKYAKPYLPMILLAIVLLFAQANFDLALPDYMSRIVNVGIQQGGVEEALPEAVRQSTMDKLVLFMSAEDKTAVLDAYTLVEPSSAQAADYIAKYPVLETEPVYVLKTIDKDLADRLNIVMGKSFLVVSTLQQVMDDPSKASSLGQNLGFDLSKIPAGMDLFAILQTLPESQRTQMRDKINQQFDAMGPDMIAQAAVVPVKAEYAALGMDTGSLQNRYILRIGGIMLLLTLLSAVATVIVGYLSARTAAGLARDVRRKVFEKVESFSNAEFEKFSTASLITRSTNDITQIQMVTVMLVRMVFYAPIIGVGGIIRALGKGSSMWWIIALAVLLLISLILVIFSIALPKFKMIQKLIDRLNLVARENLSGMMVIRAFNMQEYEENRFDKANIDLTAISLFINRLMVIVMPLMMFIMSSITLLIIWVGAHEVAQANMQVGDMMAFMQYAMQIIFSFLMLSMMFIILPRASVSADRIVEVLDTDLSIKDLEQPKTFSQPFKGKIDFRNVTFRYPGADTDVLHDISFTANPGETTAFIGSTGSGKSTVINLVPRFFDVTEGSILIDGVDIREVDQHLLREKIGYVPQRGMLFSGTIDSNLRYSDETASDLRLKKAAEIAQASEFIFSNEGGMESEIAQGGTNVSGGQKQRLSIARALVKQPPIYIFDDSFSALDFKTESALRRALKEETGDSTVLIVTQRVSTVKTAEQIVVLEEGKVVGKGTHSELMETCETYREIALSQLSLEELL
jgi:ATP-binding cassette subfamily B multidrug efflux pump